MSSSASRDNAPPLQASTTGELPLPQEQPACASSGSLAPRVLVIENDLETLEEIVSLLESSGYEVASASEWPVALLLALNFQADLVLLDTSLPGLSSRAATHIFHSAPDFGTRFRRVPFLYLAQRSHIITQRFDHHPDLPVAEYLFKPIDPEILLDRVQRSLQGSSSSGSASTLP